MVPEPRGIPGTEDELEKPMANPLFPDMAEPASYDHAQPTALVVAEPGNARDAAIQALVSAGCRVRGPIGFGEAVEEAAHFSALNLIVVEAAQAPEAVFDLVFQQIDALAAAQGLGVVATVTTAQIDAAAAQLRSPHVQLLCEPSEAERASAVAWVKWRARAKLHDARRDAESIRLQRLNEEVARIADTLARLTRGEPMAPRDTLREPSNGYRASPDGGAPEIDASEIRAVIRSRRLRAQFFDGELFADPAWDMLLDLFAAQLERRQVSVSSLCIAAAVPPTTALRWIGTMHDVGLFVRHADPSDRRRAYIGLSDKAMQGMRNYLNAVRRAGLSLA